jgi:RNA polymerase sigma-70 factor (ECF subfamily)
MAESEPTPPLCRISTHWDLLYQAHRGEGEAVSEAKRLLLLRYSDAVYRYLFKAVRDPDAAAELSQEFALRFLRGDFKRLQQEKGRFRDFLGTVLYHLVVDYHRRNQARPAPLPSESEFHPPAPNEIDISEEQFTAEWKQELLNRAWQALEEDEKEHGRLFYTVLRWRAENPKAAAGQIAQELQARLHRPFTEEGIRQTLHRAREKYAEVLLAEVARSLENPCPGQVEEELSDLGLLVYCQPGLSARSSQS